MDSLQAIVLAIVQGLSEFLPISSSGHLILVPHFLGWTDQGLAFDVAVHVGTLFAVVAYFRKQLFAMTRAWFGSLAGGGMTPDARLAWCIVVGTIPVGIVGLLFSDLIEKMLRNPLFVAGTLSVFGLLMWLADRLGRQQRDEYSGGLARRDPDRLRTGAGADARHLAFRRDDDDGAHARADARGRGAVLVPARGARHRDGRRLRAAATARRARRLRGLVDDEPRASWSPPSPGISASTGC